jgi:hypothetical protein
MFLKVRSIEFDDFTLNDDGTCWTQMCLACQNKLRPVLGNLYDDHGGGACGIKGCHNPDSEETVYVNIPGPEIAVIIRKRS